VREPDAEHRSPAAAIRPIAAKLGCKAATLRLEVRPAARDRKQRVGLSRDERERRKALERASRARRRANEIRRPAAASVAAAALDRRRKP
jgi:hypothetical protein